MPTTLQRNWIVEHEDELAIDGDEALAVIVSRLPASAMLSVADVAAALDISRSVVYAWLDEGAFRHLVSNSGATNSHYSIFRYSFIEFLKSRIR